MLNAPAGPRARSVISRRQLLLALSSLPGLGACAHPPWNPYKNWEIARTKHITAYTNTRVRYDVTLENLELAYAALHSSLFKKRPISPVEVVLLEQPEFEQVLGQYRGSVTVAKLPGRGMLGRRGIMVMYGQDLSVERAAHRIAHLFLHANAPSAPLWLHEAIAGFVELIEYRDDGADAATCLGKLGPKQPELPLRDLFSWSWSGYDESQKAAWYRYTGASLIDYFMLGEGGALRAKFGEFLGEIADGGKIEEVLGRVYPGLTVPSLETKSREHRRQSETGPNGPVPRGICPLPFPIPAEKRADSNRARVEPALQEDIAQLMLQLRLLPRRNGYVDWYPPEMVGLAGGQFSNAGTGR